MFANLLIATLCSKESVLREVEKALINNSSGNLLRLHTLFYPPDYLRTQTVSVIINSCNFTVDGYESTKLIGEPAPFVNCSSSCNQDKKSKYCLNITQGIQIFLSEDANSNSHSKLLNFLSSRRFSSFIMMTEYVSFTLFNGLTNSQIDRSEVQLNDSIVNLNFSLSELDTVTSLSDIVESLKTVFVWVSKIAFIRTYVCTLCLSSS